MALWDLEELQMLLDSLARDKMIVTVEDVINVLEELQTVAGDSKYRAMLDSGF